MNETQHQDYRFSVDHLNRSITLNDVSTVNSKAKSAKVVCVDNIVNEVLKFDALLYKCYLNYSIHALRMT